MNSVTVDGVIYTKASDLAKKFGYTTDYIGQLCRAEKVDAQLIGRSWYVREDTLLVHKDSRYKSLRENEITNKVNLNSAIPTTTKVMVLPVLSKTTKRAVLARQAEPNFFSRVGNATPLRYESDEAELLPKPALVEVKKDIPVALAASEKIVVHLHDKPSVGLEFTDLPSVSLKGILPIMPYETVPAAPAVPVVLPTEDNFKANKPKIVESESKTSKTSNPFVPTTLPPVTSPASGGMKVVFSALVLACVVSFILISFDSYISFEGTTNSEKLIFNAASLGVFFGQ